MFAWHTQLEEIVLLFSATEFPLWKQTQSCTGGPRRIQEVSLTLLKNISPAQFADLMASYSNRPSTLLYN